MPSVGKSSYFISHSWSYRFRELLVILESFEEQTKPEHTVYYWFDIFVMNQHSHEDLNQHSLLKHLVDSIKGPGRVLLAMDSWRDPSPLTRVWCLLEIFTAMEQGVELTMCFSSAEQASFAEKLQAQSQAEVQRVLERVDAEKGPWERRASLGLATLRRIRDAARCRAPHTRPCTSRGARLRGT